jgi:hypothetical protein
MMILMSEVPGGGVALGSPAIGAPGWNGVTG